MKIKNKIWISFFVIVLFLILISVANFINYNNFATNLNVKIPSNNLTTLFILSTLPILFIGVLWCIMGRYFASSIMELFNASEKISNGDFDINIDIKSTDELYLVGTNITNIAAIFDKVTNEINNLNYKINEKGIIKDFINEKNYNGSYKKLVKSINTLLDSCLSDMFEISDFMNQFALGNFNADPPMFKGEKYIITKSLLDIKNSIKTLNDNLVISLDNIKLGDLDTKIDTDNWKGNWKDIANSINQATEEIKKPLSETIIAVKKLSIGDLSASIDGDYKGDFAVLKNAINSTHKELGRYMYEINYVLTELSNNNLDLDIKEHYVGDFSTLKQSILKTIDNLNKGIVKITASTIEVSKGSKYIVDYNTTLVANSDSTRNIMTKLSDSFAQIDNSIKVNTDVSVEISNLSTNMQKLALDGLTNMNDMLVSMDEISKSSNDIKTIINVIDDIAFQTNLLALNASVEAARAGVHGKGFAIVAEEVGNLAKRSLKAAQDTTDLITESISKVTIGTTAANKTSKTLKEITQKIDDVNLHVDKVNKANTEQSSYVNNVRNFMATMTDLSNQNTSINQKELVLSTQLEEQAAKTAAIVGLFKLRPLENAKIEQAPEQPKKINRLVIEKMRTKTPVVNTTSVLSEHNFESNEYGKY